ncbi:cytochrome P450 [Dietzia sp. CQ4]|uniref:cytochrome P450 n=1 Tax=Dietzia TaxID=37914 RepID=UPI0015C8B019|nr:cytochrome P450 [Dietzia sp. CQ4]
MSELYNPYDPAVQADPYPIYQVLREESPVYWNKEQEFWALSRFDDIWAATQDHRRFSSAKGIVVGQDLAAGMGDLMPMMIMMDPPRHSALRKLVSRAFTPRRIAEMEGSIRATARGLLGSFIERGEVDFVHEYAGPLPTIVIADMLGIPNEDRQQFRDWSDRLVQVNPNDPASVEDATNAALGLYGYFTPMLAARRANRKDDLMSALLDAEVDGETLTEEELLGFCFMLLIAGNETTTNLISNTAQILSERPETLRTIAAEHSLLPAAVEEFLRLESPVQGLARTVTEDVELHGETMRAGSKVMLLYGSANRDEREYADPESFILDRKTERGLAFGHGPHFCLGAALARLECRVAYEELLSYVPDFALADGAERLLSGPVRGYKKLPITFEPTSISAR